MNRFRVLFIIDELGKGGVSWGIVNFAMLLHDHIDFDVMILNSKIDYSHQFSEYGSIYHIPISHGENRISYAKSVLMNNVIIKNELYKFLINSTYKYDVVHCKSLSYAAACMEASKSAGIKKRIAQSHVDKPKKMHPFFIWYYKWCSARIEKNATDKLAVSDGAAKYLFGKYGGRIIKNPTISLNRLNPKNYNYPESDAIRLIQIGTYSERKNQIFSLRILESLIKNGEKTHLTYVGYPVEKKYFAQLKTKIEETDLFEFISFLPKDTDIPNILAQSDYMLLPSLREGLPNVALEAQAMGVPCFLSNEITRSTDCGLCIYLDLKDGENRWANEIIQYKKTYGKSKRYVDMSAWDNRTIVKDYLDLWGFQNKIELLKNDSVY